MKSPVLLSFNVPVDKAARIRLLAMRLKVRLQTVTPQEQGQSLAALCGVEPPAEESAAQTPFTEEMLVMAFFSGELLNQFLQTYRQEKIPSISLKAMLTDTNLRWSACALWQELVQERDAIAAAQPGVHETSET